MRHGAKCAVCAAIAVLLSLACVNAHAADESGDKAERARVKKQKYLDSVARIGEVHLRLKSRQVEWQRLQLDITWNLDEYWRDYPEDNPDFSMPFGEYVYVRKAYAADVALGFLITGSVVFATGAVFMGVGLTEPDRCEEAHKNDATEEGDFLGPCFLAGFGELIIGWSLMASGMLIGIPSGIMYKIYYDEAMEIDSAMQHQKPPIAFEGIAPFYSPDTGDAGLVVGFSF